MLKWMVTGNWFISNMFLSRTGKFIMRTEGVKTSDFRNQISLPELNFGRLF